MSFFTDEYRKINKKRKTKNKNKKEEEKDVNLKQYIKHLHP